MGVDRQKLGSHPAGHLPHIVALPLVVVKLFEEQLRLDGYHLLYISACAVQFTLYVFCVHYFPLLQLEQARVWWMDCGIERTDYEDDHVY